ncbi:hypothetical protein AUR04nite_14680 [Glutamicibacter uratoxydans]|uniref:HTH cro/C1-type domain-containing protein n=1 Tax=Glutamicibacter uratoxydans TaxID=43667 RepID=A0A4Y4DLX7_GLUUR|nr:helix-turn-helix transcriptional regulator [Glutamicibacter uratoxydans]GED05936.1 hypothetical protein AUR04nite_14680 [Glutamicibacter uratoxydans]
MESPNTFWEDLRKDLEDPEFLREYIVESVRIATIDSIVNELDGARVAAGLSKADLARAINANPATVRRLFSGTASNPTLGTLSEVAAALGMKVTLEPLSNSQREWISRPLIDGHAANAKELGECLDAFGQTSSTAA